MLKILLKSKLSAFLASFSGAGASKRKKPQSPVAKVLLIILFVFLIGYLMMAFGMMAVGMTISATQTGDLWVSQTLATLIASALCVFGSVFTAKTQIFESKDNELLLAMPIPPKYIFLSRIIMLLIVNYGLESIVLLPVIGVHAVMVGYSLLGAILTLFVFLLLPLFTITISVLLAWLISIISARLKNKTAISVIFTVLFMTIYLLACGAFGGFIGSTDENTVIDFSGLKSTALFYWMGRAMAEADLLSFLWVALCTILPAILAYFLLDRSFIKIITIKTGAKTIKYVAGKEKVSTVQTALFKKEIKRFFSSSAYVLNAGIGNIMTIIFAVLIALASPEINLLAAQEPMIVNFIPAIGSMIVMFMSSMNLVSAPSISLEDKSLWVLQSAPIEPKRILRAKLLAHMAICLPCTLIGAIIVSVAFKFSVLNFIFCILVGATTVALTAYFGLLLGLKFPKFDWQNETVAVKQGFAVFGTMLGTMLWSLVLFMVCMVFAVLSIDFWISGAIITALNAIICIIIENYFSKGGATRFAQLKH